MIKEKEFLFGAVFFRLANFYTDKNINIHKSDFDSNSSYIVNKNTGLYIKTSSKRNSPWTFTFSKENQDEIQELKNKFGSVFIILVCKDDGIVSLSFDELKHILDYDHEETEWIRVMRKKGEKYMVYGHDGELPYKIGDNEFPKKIIDVL